MARSINICDHRISMVVSSVIRSFASILLLLSCTIDASLLFFFEQRFPSSTTHSFLFAMFTTNLFFDKFIHNPWTARCETLRLLEYAVMVGTAMHCFWLIAVLSVLVIGTGYHQVPQLDTAVPIVALLWKCPELAASLLGFLDGVLCAAVMREVPSSMLWSLLAFCGMHLLDADVYASEMRAVVGVCGFCAVMLFLFATLHHDIGDDGMAVWIVFFASSLQMGFRIYRWIGPLQLLFQDVKRSSIMSMLSPSPVLSTVKA